MTIYLIYGVINAKGKWQYYRMQKTEDIECGIIVEEESGFGHYPYPR